MLITAFFTPFHTCQRLYGVMSSLSVFLLILQQFSSPYSWDILEQRKEQRFYRAKDAVPHSGSFIATVIEKTNIFARPSGLGNKKLKQFSKNLIKITDDQILLNQKVLTLSPNSASTTLSTHTHKNHLKKLVKFK